jgi:putative toxin-antitoxin system antitoxin component (TIGR02293 family)
MATVAAVEHLLGGREVLGMQPQTIADWEAIIQQGMPMRSVEVLKECIAISDSQLAALLGISEKTLSRARAVKGKLDSVASDRLFRVARVVALASEVLEDDTAGVNWLKRAQMGLGGRVPLAMLTTDPGRDQVEKLLLRIEHGVYS